MEQIKEMIKNNEFSRVMIFHGDENFMLDFYLKKATSAIIDGGDMTMNYDFFNDKKTAIDVITDSVDTMPFFADQRVVVLGNLGVFDKTRSSFAADLVEVITSMPDTTYMIIVEDNIDKRTKLYKTVAKLGTICEFPYLSEGELVKYIARSLGRYSIKIEGQTARYLIDYVGNQLTLLHNELEKLASYLGEESVATKEAIEDICQKSVENKIFELVDCMGTKRRSRALKLYHDLLASKEPANRILFMITRQFRLNYKAKLLNGEGLTINNIASRLKIQSFIAKKCLAQSNGFTLHALEEALADSLQCEINIRTSVFTPELAVEQLIIKYSG